MPLPDPTLAARLQAREAATLTTRIVSGRTAILALAPLLVDLSHRCAQPGAMDFLDFFLSSSEALSRTPHLVLVGPGLDLPATPASAAIGALLVHERRLLNLLPTRILTTDDISGRRTLLAPPRSRALVAALAAQALMHAGAQILLLSFLAHLPGETQADVPSTLLSGPWRYTMRLRMVHTHLRLLGTFDETLATIGQRTRSNMRYYRRRAEKELGCTFVPDVHLTEPELHHFNAESTFPKPHNLIAWRFRSLHPRRDGFFLRGIRDRDGHWLSLAGGRRFHGTAEIDWQMNRADHLHLSLSTVLRAYILDHEIALGSSSLAIEGGTPHAIRFSFAVGTITDLALIRPSLAVRLFRAYGARFLPAGEHFLHHILTSPAAEWKPWT